MPRRFGQLFPTIFSGTGRLVSPASQCDGKPAIRREVRTGWRHRLAAVCLLAVGLTGSLPTTMAAEKSDEDYYELMRLFVETFEQIERNYVKPVDRRQLMEAAMRGMITQLEDPYSNYIDRDELASFNQVVEQEFGGIGIQVTLDPKARQLVVISPLPGTPAYAAGVRAGDRILEIDGKPVAGFPEGQELPQAVKMMKGAAGSVVKVMLVHEGDTNPITAEITRAVIKTPTVLGDRYDNDGHWQYFLENEDQIAYIRLTHFSRNSAAELRDVLETARKTGMKGLILDLRNNPGGLLSAAAEISDYFVDSGVIVSTKGRNTETQVIQAKSPGTFSGFPMVVLVNRFSASASEIVSACLQDHQRATIVGERTWGKGSVQNVIELEDGKSAIKLTTASYHRPSGKNIHRFPSSAETDEWGVMPDQGYEVKMSNEQMRAYADYRRERDVFRPGKAPPTTDYQDPQLAEGLKWIREQTKSTASAPAPEKTATPPG